MLAPGPYSPRAGTAHATALSPHPRTAPELHHHAALGLRSRVVPSQRKANMSTLRIARCGLCIALLAVASSISIPVGPVPFTLQTLVLAMLPVALGGRDAIVTVALYLVLGALGLPVFSGFSGGIASLVGPTGGYLWGFLVGTVAAATILHVNRLPERACEIAAVVAMLLVAYALGTLQLMMLMHLSLAEALALAVLPFIVPDAIKLAVGVQVGRIVRRATFAHQAHA